MANGQFDSLIHAQNRLQICAILAASSEIDFKLLRERLDVSDSVLSKQLKLLEDACYIDTSKKLEGGRQRTWVKFTKQGRSAFDGHVSALKGIVNLSAN